jgi:Barstar (barnase inhibitor)
MPTAFIDAAAIHDWESFHAASKAALGFPDFYGRNMNAWIDCLTYIADGDGMSRFHLAEGETLTIEVSGADDFAARCPDQALALMGAVAAVNQRHREMSRPPMLTLLLV